jgi:hypothetical protein
VTTRTGYSAAELRERRESRLRAARRRRLVALAAFFVAAGALGGVMLTYVRAADDDPLAASQRSRAAGTVAAQRPPPPPREPVSIVFVGDIAINDPSGPVRDFFVRVRPSLRGDVVVGNLEGTLATGGASKCGPGRPNCYAFRALPAYSRTLAHAGFDVLNLANNHSGDFGAQGRTETLAALRRARIRPTGHETSPPVVRAGRVRVAVLGFAPGHPGWDLRDTALVRTRVRRAARRADLVVVTMHAGAEGADATHVSPADEIFLGANRGNVVAFARAAVNAGADLVVGHGPHVLRGMEWYRGRLIAYSVGNFVGYRSLNNSGLAGVTAILRATLRGDGGWIRGRLVPVRIIDPGMPVPDQAEEAHGVVRRLSREDFGRRGARIATDGRILRPRR